MRVDYYGGMERERLSIVHVTTFYPPHHFGGDGVQVQRLSRALARRGHEVTVVYPPAAFRLLGGNTDDAGPEGDDGVRLQPLPAGALGTAEAFLVQQTGAPVLSRGALRRVLTGGDGRRPDVIHYHNVSLVGGIGVLGLGDAIKLYTTHEYWLVCPTHVLFRYNREICRRRTCTRCTLHSGRPPQLWRSRARLHRGLHSLDSFIFPSRSTESVYRAQGIDAPGTVMHHFLPDEYIESAANRGERSAGVEPFFLYVGRIDAVKGVPDLARHFAERETPAPLYIVGDGPLEKELRARYADHPRLRFFGHLSQERLGALYRDALALILPSAGYEVFGLVVIEAFAHGTPAIVSSVCGAAELVHAGDAGHVYGTPGQLDAALRELAAEPGRRAALGANGLRYVRRAHREDDYVTRYEQLVRELRRP